MRANEFLQSVAQLLEQSQSAATQEGLEAPTNAISRIQIPAPQVGLSAILEAVNALRTAIEKRPRKWEFEFVKNQLGTIKRIIATAG